MKTCCNSLKERGIWEFDFFNNSRRVRESLACFGEGGALGYIPVTSPTPLQKFVLLIMISTTINNSNTDNNQVFRLKELKDNESTTTNQ